MIAKSITLNGLDLLALLGEDFTEGGTLTIMDEGEAISLDLDNISLLVDVGDEPGDMGDLDDEPGDLDDEPGDLLPFGRN